MVWTKYCASQFDTHALGIAKAQKDFADKLAGRRKTSNEYRGFIEALSGDVRSVMPKLYEIFHVPKEGRPHAEVDISPDMETIVNANLDADERKGTPNGTLSRKDARTHAILKLMHVFSPLVGV